jgi:hypothetical protein
MGELCNEALEAEARARDAERQAQKARNLGAMYGTGATDFIRNATPPGSSVETRKRRIFLDMDGVLADFERMRKSLSLTAGREITGDDLKAMHGAFSSMQPMAGAIAGVKSLIGMGFDVWIASKPATGKPHTYSEKAAWILFHFDELKRKIILTHDKGMLGCAEDYLVDDRIHKANCVSFRGRLLHFGWEAGALDWGDLVDFFRSQDPTYQTFNVRVP